MVQIPCENCYAPGSGGMRVGEEQVMGESVVFLCNGCVNYLKTKRVTKVEAKQHLFWWKHLSPAQKREVRERQLLFAAKFHLKDRRARTGYAPTAQPNACTLLKAHHELMKDDPDRLSTEFMQKMLKVKCKCDKGKK